MTFLHHTTVADLTDFNLPASHKSVCIIGCKQILWRKTNCCLDTISPSIGITGIMSISFVRFLRDLIKLTAVLELPTPYNCSLRIIHNVKVVRAFTFIYFYFWFYLPYIPNTCARVSEGDWRPNIVLTMLIDSIAAAQHAFDVFKFSFIGGGGVGGGGRIHNSMKTICEKVLGFVQAMFCRLCPWNAFLTFQVCTYLVLVL